LAIRKLQVFLASPFEEFTELRQELAAKINRPRMPPAEAIDLNDNSPDARPPLDRCYEGIDRAEVVVVLVGERYRADDDSGTADMSYTHLEYRRALENRSKIILPFLVDHRDPRTAKAHEVADRALRRWIQEIEANQCISRLDARLPPTRLAAEIYDAVAERIFEAFTDTAGVPGSDDEDDDAAAREITEDAPIKRTELANAPKLRPPLTEPLRTSAAEHAREALQALEINLPWVAIHHLRKAVDLIPLDVVLSYWLARLLIATGGVAECKEGRQHAQRCARVAEKSHDTPRLGGMAALILAARANERLGDLEAALASARAAHEAVSYHWLAKLEFGRQCALSGHFDEAKKYATEAFWLRPDSILRMRSDSAYSTMGSKFERFWAELRDTMVREEKRIGEMEKSCEWLADHLGAGAKPVTAPAGARDWSGRVGILALVRTCRLSTRRSLELLQGCAAKLLSDAADFTFRGLPGLSASTATHLQSTIDAERGAVVALEAGLSRATETESLWQDRRRRAIGLGGVAAGALTVVAASTFLGGWPWFGAASLVALVMAVAATGSANAAAREQILRASATRKQTHAELVGARTLLQESADAQRIFAVHLDSLRQRIAIFSEAVRRFEKTAAARLALSPAVSSWRAGVGDVARVDPERLEPDGPGYDGDLLPPSLVDVAGIGWSVFSGVLLARRIRTADGDVFSRWAVYFSLPRGSAEPGQRR